MLKRLLFAALMLLAVAAQAAVYSLPWGPKPQFVDANGAPMSSGTLTFYAAGSTTPQNTYTTQSGAVANSNPITLNSRGETPNEVWLTGGQTYKLVLKDSSGATVWTVDNISGVNDTTATFDQWVTGPTPTYVSATSFTLSGDQTSAFHVGRRIKTSNSGGTVYSTITASAYVSSTTVTVANDSGNLDAGLSAVSYALLSNTSHSIPSFRAKGDVLTQSAAGTIARLAVGSNGAIPMARSADSLGIAYVAALNKVIYGLTYSNNVADATNDIDIATGGAMDATGAYFMVLGSALTKQLDAAWAVGTNQGGLDTGAVGNNDYYIWLIARSDTGVVDVLFSLSSTSPTMPSNYDYKRLIGWFKRVGGTNVAFTTYENDGGGLDFRWNAPTLDVNLSNTLTTSRRTDAVKVPLNFSTRALVTVYVTDASVAFFAWVGDPNTTDAAPSESAAPLHNLQAGAGLTTPEAAADIEIRTSATGTIAARASIATVDLYAVVTRGFLWSRR